MSRSSNFTFRQGKFRPNKEAIEKALIKMTLRLSKATDEFKFFKNLKKFPKKNCGDLDLTRPFHQIRT